MNDTSFFVKAAEVLSKCHKNREDLAALLHPENGFAPNLSRICKSRLDEMLDGSPDVVDILRLESNTWDLLQTLMSLRKTEPKLPPSARELLEENPYTPTATLANSIIKHSPLLNELIVVREWLHDSAPAPRAPEATNGYWKFTRLRLLQAQRMGNKKELDTLVKDLDPDAVERDDRVLAADDANYEKALAQALYAHVRAGKLDDAVELCRTTRRPWRAASIRGSLLFQWKLLSHVAEDEPTDMDPDFADGWSGNKRRKLWKSTCTRGALNPALSAPERALYAALAPSPATSVALRAACRTWEDHLWAQVCIVCEGKAVGELMRAYGGGYWEAGADVVRRIERAGVTNGHDVQDGEVEMEMDSEEEWAREVVDTLESIGHVAVTDGPPSTDPFHVSQLHIILNRTDKLIADFAAGLESGEFNPEQLNYATLTRFFAHLCLFLQLIDVPVPPEATQVILEVYLQVLEDAGQREHIALYASALGDNAIERYSLFLAGMDLSSDLEERRVALLRAKEHSLDVVRVAQATAEKSVEKAFEVLPRMKITLPSVTAREVQLSDMEWYLIRSIEWTTFIEDTYREALEQANAILRYFLGCGRVQAAKTLLTLLPVSLRSIQDTDREHGGEFLHYLQFFTISDLFERITEYQLAESGCTTKGAREDWVKGYKSLLDEIRGKIVELLTTEWLVNEEEAAKSHDQRHATLIRIRQIYIPELIIRIHALLVGSGDKLPENLKHALNLSNIVADSRYRLYEDFLAGEGDRLKDYLLAVRQAVLKSLETGGSDPLRVFIYQTAKQKTYSTTKLRNVT